MLITSNGLIGLPGTFSGSKPLAAPEPQPYAACGEPGPNGRLRLATPIGSFNEPASLLQRSRHRTWHPVWFVGFLRTKGGAHPQRENKKVNTHLESGVRVSDVWPPPRGVYTSTRLHLLLTSPLPPLPLVVPRQRHVSDPAIPADKLVGTKSRRRVAALVLRAFCLHRPPGGVRGVDTAEGGVLPLLCEAFPACRRRLQ